MLNSRYAQLHAIHKNAFQHYGFNGLLHKHPHIVLLMNNICCVPLVTKEGEGYTHIPGKYVGQVWWVTQDTVTQWLRV